MRRAEVLELVLAAFGATSGFGRALMILLAIVAKARERHYHEARFGDFEAAILAHAVFLSLDPLERGIYLANLDPLALGKRGAYVAIALFRGSVGAIQTIASIAVSLSSELGARLVAKPGFRVPQMLGRPG
jgi:hypothetical protein